MAKNRQIILFDNWLKGINTQQKLAEKGFSKTLMNFECARGGALEKVRNAVSYPIPDHTNNHLSTNDPSISSIVDFCFFTSGSKTYLVAFGDVGIYNNPKIQAFDGTSWGPVWHAADGYLPDTVTSVIFVPSYVGGRACLRIYPQGPATTPSQFKLLRPLMIYEHPEKSVKESWSWTELSTVSTGEFGYLYGSKTVTIWENVNDAINWEGCKVTCSCGRERRGDWPPNYALGPFLKPCIGENTDANCSASYCLSCGNGGTSYAAHQTKFTTDFAIGDIAGFDFYVPYGTPNSPSVIRGQWMARVTAIVNDQEMYVADGCRRFISATGAPHIQIQGNPTGAGDAMYFVTLAGIHDGHGFQSRLYRIRQAALVPGYLSTVSAGLTCLKGLPITDSGSLSGVFSTERRQIQDWIPSEINITGYGGSESIQYGYSYVTIDGCHSNISKIFLAIPPRFRYKYIESVDCLSKWGDGFVLLTDSFYPDASIGAYEEVRKRIKGCNIWRWGPRENKWMLLAYIPYIADKDGLNPVDNSRVFVDSSNNLWQSFSLKFGLAYWVNGILDIGQPLAASIYDTTEGLEEKDMGFEYMAKTVGTQGRKIFVGNFAGMKAADAVTVPEWKDDDILFSLFDKGSNFNAEDYLSIISGDPDQIVKIGFFGRQMIVAKRDGIFIVDILGSVEGNWKQVAQFKNGILSDKHFTMTPFGPVWISVDGVMFWDGEKLVNITENILDDFRIFHTAYSTTMCIGFDRLTNKVYITEPSVGRAYVIALETGTLTIAKALKATSFINDVSGRALMKLTGGLLSYPEAKINELSSGFSLIGDNSIWESSEIDLVDLAGEGKLYRLYFYVTYKKNTVNAHLVKLGTSFDGAALVETDIATALCLDEVTTVFELDVWKRGRILTISLNTNEGTSVSYFQYFRLWKVAATVRLVDVD